MIGFWHRLANLWKKKPLLLFYLLALSPFLFPDVFTPFSPFDLPAKGPLPPGATENNHFFLLGTDVLGRDLLSLLLHGAFHSFIKAFLGVLFAVILGGILCGFHNYLPKFLQPILEIVLDLWMSFPIFLVLWVFINLSSPTENSLLVTFLTIGGLYAPFFFRRFHSWYKDFQYAPHLQAAKALGLPKRNQWLFHILPSWQHLFGAQIFLTISRVLLTLVSLAVFGLRAPMESAGLGVLLWEGMQGFSQAPWVFWSAFFGSVTLIILFYQLGELYQNTSKAAFYGPPIKKHAP